MRIEDDFDDSKNAPGLKGAEQLGKSNSGIGNFAKDGNQDRTVKVKLGKLAITESRGDKFHVCAAGGLRLGPGPGKHSRLHVKRDNTATWADAPG